MDFFGFLGAIGDIFNEIASVLSELFVALWDYMVALFQFIWNVLVAFGTFVLTALQKLPGFFENLWSNYIKPAINWVISHIDSLYKTLSKWTAWAMKWIQKIKLWYDTHILPNMMKQLALIQKIRQYLVLLRILHVKFAQQLDNWLSQAQSTVTNAILVVQQTLNLVIDWISIVADPNNVIRRTVLGSWLLSHVGALKRLVGYGDNRPLTDAEKATMAANSGRYNTATVQAHINTLLTSGPTADDNAARSAFRNALAAELGTPLPF